MPSLSLRGLSDQVYEGLRQLAIRNHRSMQEQVRLLIEREVGCSPSAREQTCACEQQQSGIGSKPDCLNRGVFSYSDELLGQSLAVEARSSRSF
jgi:plasmid stability protein